MCFSDKDSKSEPHPTRTRPHTNPPAPTPGQTSSRASSRQRTQAVPSVPQPPPPPPLPTQATPRRGNRSSPPRSTASRASSSSRIIQFIPDPISSPNGLVIHEAAQAIANCLRQSDIHWAIVGGGSCVLLGAPRTTDDIDFVVAHPESVREAKNLLTRDPRITVEPRTRQTYFHLPGYPPLRIDVLCTPSTFKEPFNAGTTVLDVRGYRLSSLSTLLNSKCGSIPQRTTDAKRYTDLEDIIFILRIAASRSVRFDPGEVKNVTRELKAWLETMQPGVSQFFSPVGL